MNDLVEKKNCQNCKKDFPIEQEDLNFYEKLKVPPPTWCPECRMIRRISFHNLWSVYWRNCERCDKKVLSMFNKDIPLRVFCSACWWADDWDGTEYAMDYDPSRSFFDQLHELALKTPWVAQETIGPTLVNAEYCNGASWIKNGYLSFWADYCENIAHTSIAFQLKDSSDCMRATESELCYESIGVKKCYRTFFSEECEACTDVWFSRNCYSCTSCVGCTNLRGASYCIFNKKYSKEEYTEKIAELGLDSWSKLRELEKKAHAFWLENPYREYTGNSLNLNVSGEYIFESKNAHNLYMCTNVENSRHVQFVTVPSVKDSYDYSGWGANSEMMYESVICGENASNVKFSFSCYPDNLNIEYCIWASNVKNSFGCINLKRKKYCILNKEYTKEEYEKLREKIIEDMKNNPYIDELGRGWSYGEFFPNKMNFYGYNESNASKFFPRTKEEVLAQGFSWYEKEEYKYNITINPQDLPEKIQNTENTITDEVIECVICKKGYKIALLELNLLKKMNIPIPHSCPQCRTDRHFKRLNPARSWDRNCDKCDRSIKTAFAPDRPEIVYCEKCYQQEVY